MIDHVLGRSAGPCRHLTQAELAERWQVSQRTLMRWRALGVDPASLRLNGRIRYRLVDVLAFERSRLHVALAAGRPDRRRPTG